MFYFVAPEKNHIALQAQTASFLPLLSLVSQRFTAAQLSWERFLPEQECIEVLFWLKMSTLWVLHALQFHFSLFWLFLNNTWKIRMGRSSPVVVVK